MGKAPLRTLLLALVLAAAAACQGCGFYFKTYRYKSPEPFAAGMSQQDVLGQWGSPLSVQVLGPAQVWKYFADEPEYGKSKHYYLVWFQNGEIVKWEKKEEERLPPQPAA